MKIEELVPPLELCKKIPAGEFEDTAFIWDKTDKIGFWDGFDKDGNEIGGFGKIPAMNWRVRQNYSDHCRKRMKESGRVLNVYPAPTLQEIMEELEPLQDAFFEKFDDGVRMWMVADSGYESNAATAALNAWLKLKGVEE